MRDKKTSNNDDMYKSLNELLRRRNRTRRGGSVASKATSKARAKIIKQCLKQLKARGYFLTNINDFKERHVIYLAKLWEKQKLSASTVQTRMSILRILGNEWLNKPGMIRGTECYFSSDFNVHRSSITKKDKSWLGNGVNFESTLLLVHSYDPYVSLCLEFMCAFGLRKKETIMFQPHLSDHGILIKITRGAKTGKKRVVPVLTESQKELLQRARLMIKPGESLANPDKSLIQNLRRFDYVVAKAGITKKVLGVTSQGLRHGNGQNDYFSITGELVPVKDNSNVVDKGIDKQARLEISERLGHSRVSITNHYFGKK